MNPFERARQDLLQKEVNKEISRIKFREISENLIDVLMGELGDHKGEMEKYGISYYEDFHKIKGRCIVLKKSHSINIIFIEEVNSRVEIKIIGEDYSKSIFDSKTLIKKIAESALEGGLPCRGRYEDIKYLSKTFLIERGKAGFWYLVLLITILWFLSGIVRNG